MCAIRIKFKTFAGSLLRRLTRLHVTGGTGFCRITPRATLTTAVFPTSYVFCVCVCVCVCVAIPFILDVRFVDVPAGVTQEEGDTGFLHLPSAVLALIFLARRIRSFLSLVDQEVEFCFLTN